MAARRPGGKRARSGARASPSRGARGAPRDAARTRSDLVDAAAKLFNEVGYHGTDSNRIARAAGYAPASFYKHFGDKREIFLATYAQWVEVEWEQIRSELMQGRRGTLARITQLVLDHHRRWAVLRQSLRALAATDPVVRAFRIEQREAQLGFMADLLRGAGGVRPSRARCLLALLSFERVCDAIADGEVAALGVSEATLVRSLQEQLQALGSD